MPLSWNIIKARLFIVQRWKWSRLSLLRYFAWFLPRTEVTTKMESVECNTKKIFNEISRVFSFNFKSFDSRSSMRLFSRSTKPRRFAVEWLRIATISFSIFFASYTSEWKTSSFAQWQSNRRMKISFTTRKNIFMALSNFRCLFE